MSGAVAANLACLCACGIAAYAGSGRNSLHLALWGTIDTNSNTLAMTVGLPGNTLAKAGLRGLPPGYLLPVAVSGPLHRPQVEWNAAGKPVLLCGARFYLPGSCVGGRWLGVHVIGVLTVLADLVHPVSSWCMDFGCQLLRQPMCACCCCA